MDFDPKEFAFQLCVKTLQVAKNQYQELKQKLFDLHTDLRTEQLKSQDHNFLAIPDIEENVELEVVIKHLKKYHVTLKFMSNETSLSEDFTQSLREATAQVLQLMESLKQALTLLREDLDYDTIDEGQPVIPDDLRVESQLSARQRRDFIVVRNYNKLLELFEAAINRYLASAN